MKIQGPVQVKIEVRIISKNGKQNGVATLPMNCFAYPTKEELKKEVARFAENEMPKGFRLMNKKEAFNSAWEEITHSSTPVAIPGGDEWDE